MVGNSEVGHEILARFEVSCQSQLDGMGIQVGKFTKTKNNTSPLVRRHLNQKPGSKYPRISKDTVSP